MDEHVLAIAKLFRAQQKQILQIRSELAALQRCIGEENLETVVTLAEDEHSYEQMDAQIKLLEYGKDLNAKDT
jgi:hypothetical protein